MRGFVDIRTKRDQFLVDIRKEDLHDRITNSRLKVFDMKKQTNNPEISGQKHMMFQQFKTYKQDFDYALSHNSSA